MRKLLLLMGALVAFLAVGVLLAGPLSAAQKPAATVNMNGSTFSPESVTISAGQSVEFVNDDDLPHTVTATDKSFDSGNIDSHHSWTYTFSKAGTYVYGCTYHAWMHGTVKVLPLAKATPMARNVRS
jgi:plastocyanin